MSDYDDKAVENMSYCMPSGYKKTVAMQNDMSMYPSWNARADKQAKYPDATMQAAKSNKQVMK